MYQGILFLHNVLRWIILLLAILAIVKAYAGMTSRKSFNNGDKRVGSFLMISAHTTFVLGLYQWLVGPWGIKNVINLGMAAIMKDPVYRYWAIEHITGMLIAIILITIGRGVSRKNIAERIKHRRTFMYYTVALLIILLTIPWPFRAGIGRPLIPGTH